MPSRIPALNKTSTAFLSLFTDIRILNFHPSQYPMICNQRYKLSPDQIQAIDMAILKETKAKKSLPGRKIRVLL
jgi:hypothetical protein